jgi:hypothetical protein
MKMLLLVQMCLGLLLAPTVLASIIVKIDNDPKLGRIVHIAMRGLKIKNQRSLDGVSDRVDHLPFAGWFR